MCKSKTRTNAMDPPQPSISRRSASTSASTSTGAPTSTDSGRVHSSATATTSSSSSSSHPSLASLRSSLPENPHIYSFSEISAATNGFLSKRISSSSSAWLCTLRSKPSVVIQRKLRRPLDGPLLRRLLSHICRSHHSSIVKLLGASISGDFVYLVYDYVPGANLSDCLRNPKNPNFTVLSTWLSRMQIATNLAQGLEYIHHYSGSTNLVHNHIKPSSIIVTDPSLNAMICHYGASLITGETPDPDTAASSPSSKSKGKLKLERSDSRVSMVEGVRGYMCPEFLTAGMVSQKSDVFAYGVVMLELMSGEEPLKYRFDKRRGDYERISLIESAREAVEEGVVWRWMDRRLKDASYSLEVAEKMMRLALECVSAEPDQRPDMKRVAGKVSKMHQESRVWADRMRLPTDFSVSMAPR